MGAHPGSFRSDLPIEVYFGQNGTSIATEYAELDRRLTVRAHAVSGSARAKIEAAGGAVEIIEAVH